MVFGFMKRSGGLLPSKTTPPCVGSWRDKRANSDIAYSVLEAENAVTALALMEPERLDLLFTDLVMPGELSGLELAAAGRWPHIRVVLTPGFYEAKINFNRDTAAARLLTPGEKSTWRALHAALDA